MNHKGTEGTEKKEGRGKFVGAKHDRR